MHTFHKFIASYYKPLTLASHKPEFMSFKMVPIWTLYQVQSNFPLSSSQLAFLDTSSPTSVLPQE
jgi:hypothetical protein